MKQNIKLFLLSLAYVSTPSLILSLGIGLITGKYISTFLITFALVFLLGILSNNWLSNRTIRYLATLDFRKKDLEHQQSVEVSCASCKTRNIVPVKLAIRNTFPCSQCKVPNLIIFQFATAVVTEPLKLVQVGANTNG